MNPSLDGKKMQFEWETQRYHQPSDDMNQPFDFNATVKCTRVDLAVGYEVAQQTRASALECRRLFREVREEVTARSQVGTGALARPSRAKLDRVLLPQHSGAPVCQNGRGRPSPGGS